MKKNRQPKFLDNSIGKAVKDALFPTLENNYQPKVLQSNPLYAIVVCLIILKVAITLFLFVSYPNFALLSSEIYARIIELTNQTRFEEGVATLKINPILNEAARRKAEDMLLNQYFSHDGPDGKKPWQWIDKSRYDYVNAGENLAMNFTSAEMAHLAFLKSPTHKKNIVNSKFRDIGVAVLTGELNGKETMVMVEMFGRQREALDGIENGNLENGGEKEYVNNGEKNEELKIKNEKEIGNLKLEADGEVEEEKQIPIPATIIPEEEKSVKPVAEKNKIAVVKSVKVKNFKLNIKQNEIKELKSRTGPVAKTDIQERSNVGILASLTKPRVLEIEIDSSILALKSKIIGDSIKYSNYILIAGLCFLVLILMFNILIKIKVQHPAVICQSLIAIFVIIFLIVSKFHFAQKFAMRVIVG